MGIPSGLGSLVRAKPFRSWRYNDLFGGSSCCSAFGLLLWVCALFALKEWVSVNIEIPLFLLGTCVIYQN